MFPRLFFLAFMLMPFSERVIFAQADNYGLHEPTATEYVQQIEAIVADANTNYIFWNDTKGIAELEVLTDELHWRLIDRKNITYQQLLTIYRAYISSENADTTTADDNFIPTLIELWLTDNPPSNNYEPFIFSFSDFVFEAHPLHNGAFSLTPKQAPLNGATLHRVGFSTAATNYILIQDDHNHYQVPPLPVLMFGNVVNSGDFNADQQPDFAYLNYSHSGNSYVSGALYIVTWTGEEFETLSSLGFSHGPNEAYNNPALNWEFVQLDNDAPQEFFRTQKFHDNWGCEFIRFVYFDWQEDGALEAEKGHDIFPESFACLLRQAEENAWAGQYSEAIELYQQALAEPTEDVEALVFAQMRLGLAYLLTGQPEAAEPLFTNLAVSEENVLENHQWVSLVHAAYVRDARLLPMCQAIYNQALDILSPYNISGTVLVADGGFYGPGWYNPGVDLENVSCDLAALMKAELPTLSFSTDETPVEQLQALGLAVRHSIKADLDSDRDDDWLVWIASLGISPLLFLADGNEYALTVNAGAGWGDSYFREPDMGLPDGLNQYQVVQLPDGTPALANLDFGVDKYSQIICGGICGGGPTISCAANDYAPRPSSGMGDLTLWQLEDGQLESVFFALMCGWAYQTDLFPNSEVGRTLLAGDSFPVGEYGDREIRPVTYQWDEDQRTFVAPAQPTPLPVTPIPTPTQAPTTEPIYPLSISTYLEVRTAWAEQDFARVLTMLESALEQEPQDQMLVPAFHYYRALALEALNRPDEALAEYVAIYEAAPESAWGQLAVLHLEWVED